MNAFFGRGFVSFASGRDVPWEWSRKRRKVTLVICEMGAEFMDLVAFASKQQPKKQQKYEFHSLVAKKIVPPLKQI